MVVVDANVLVYAFDSVGPYHAESREWLDGALAGAEAVGFAWTVALAFVRLATSPAVFPDPAPVEDAVAQVERWLAAPAAVVVEPTRRHPALLRGLLAATGSAGNLVNDAHLAALAVEHAAAAVVSYDRDFQRFPGVRWRLPVPEGSRR